MAKRKKKDLPPDFPKEKSSSVDEDLLGKWKTRIAKAQRLRKNWEDKYKVDECEKFILGFQWRSERVTDPVFNHTLSTLLTLRPNIFFGNPKFYVRPKPSVRSNVSERSAAILEGVLSTVGERDDNLQNAANLALWQNFTRVGVMKVTYDPRFENNPNKGEPIYVTNSEGEVQFNKETGEAPVQKDPRTGLAMVELAEVMTDEVYKYSWVDAVNMLLPDEGPDMSKWTWIGEEVVVSLEDAKNDERFPKSIREQLSPNESDTKPLRQRKVDLPVSDERDAERIRYVEIYDIREKKLLIWADGQVFNDFLVNDDLPDGIKDHPYAVMPQWIPILGPDPLPWPEPYIFAWLDVQREYNIRRKQITEGCKRMARKIYYDDNTFPNEEEALKSLQSGQDLSAAKVNTIKNVPVILTDPPVPPSFFADLNALESDWRIITGQSGARLQDPDKGTATESSFVERAAGLRDTDLYRHVDSWLSTAGIKMKRLVESTLTLGMMINIRGYNDKEFKQYAERTYGLKPEALEFIPGLKEIFKERFGQDQWKNVTREQLQFESEVTVIPGSYKPHNLDTERSQWIQFLTMIGKYPQLTMSRELLQETASKFEYISEKMVDELYALGKKMMDAQQKTAGRSGGGGEGNGGGGSAGPGDQMQQALAGMMGGVK